MLEDQEVLIEVVRDNCEDGDASMRQISPIDTMKEPDLEEASQSLAGAS